MWQSRSAGTTRQSRSAGTTRQSRSAGTMQHSRSAGWQVLVTEHIKPHITDRLAAGFQSAFDQHAIGLWPVYTSLTEQISGMWTEVLRSQNDFMWQQF